MNFSLMLRPPLSPFKVLALLIALFVLYLLGVVVCEVCRGLRIIHRIRRHRPVTLNYGWMMGQKVIRLNLLTSLPRSLIFAVLYQEDVQFFQHWGFQYRELIRSILCSLRNRRMKGGSSISQQTVKLLCFRPYRKFGPLEFFRRWIKKFGEIPLTIFLELCFSKSEILSIYFDSANWGTHIIGVSDAANFIHKKSPADLDIAESIFLATMLMNPSWSRVVERARDFSKRGYAREVYYRSLLIQRTLDGLGTEAIEALSASSPYEFERRASTDAHFESARIERATEIVHESKDLAVNYAANWDFTVPVHRTFLSEEQRIALSLIFGRRQFVVGEGKISCDTELLSSAILIANRIGAGRFSRVTGVEFPLLLEAELIRARERDRQQRDDIARGLARILNICQQRNIDILCGTQLHFNIPVYCSEDDLETCSIELLVASDSADVLRDIVDSHQTDNYRNLLSLRIVSLTSKCFAERKCRYQKQEIAGVALFVPDPFSELLNWNRQFGDRPVQDWGQLAAIVSLVNSIDPESLALYCGAIKNQREREEIMVFLGLCSQFTINPLPRNCYVLPSDSRLSRRFLRHSYGNLFSQLEQASQGV